MKNTITLTTVILFITFRSLVLSGSLQAQTEQKTTGVNQIIPQPAEIRSLPGSFIFSDKTRLVYPKALSDVANLAKEQLGIKQSSAKNAARENSVRLSVNPLLGTEGYQVNVNRSLIDISGGSPTAVYYGVQTLRQLIGPSAKSANIGCKTIQDKPRFSWRGLMLDCSRTFQPVDYLKKTIDRLSFYKMNVLHLHLTDDQGWRIEIKSHPELTVKGARFSAKYHEPASHEGFYTQVEMKDLVRYASLRGITLVPEIEMPGHSTALLVCRPDLSCTGNIPDDIFPYGKGPGVTSDILCTGNDNTFSLMQDVLSELTDIFPSQFIHIGGDEAPKERWKNCPKCQARIKAEGLKDEHGLQSYFVRRIEKYLNSKGRRLIGWSEILQGGLAPNAAIMDWIGGAVQATKEGHDAVMTPTTHCYFDYTYKQIDSKRAFEFDPVAGLTPEQEKHIRGVQASFWSHIDREPELTDRQLYPRLLSIAERGWSAASYRNWSSCKERLNFHLKWLSVLGVHYYDDQCLGPK